MSQTFRLKGKVSSTALLFAACSATALPARGQEVSGSWTMGQPIVTGWLIGYSDGGTFTDDRANYAVDGGYNLAWVTSIADLNVAQQHGLRGMYLSPSVIDPSMVGTPALDSLITEVSARPAFYSYFAGDEPSDTAFAGLGNLVSYIRGKDPTHLSYINVLPLGAFNWASNPAAQYQTYLNSYMSTVQPSLLSYDNYEFIAPTTSQYLQNLSMITQSARTANIPFMNTVPATAVGTAPTPNSDQLRFLVYSTLAYGGTGIQYWFGGSGSTPTTAVYNALTPLNHQFVAVGKQLQGLKSIGTYLKGYQTLTSRRPPGTATVPANSTFQVNVSDTVWYHTGDPLQGVLLGLFDASGTSVTSASFALVQNIDNALSRTVMLTGPGNLSIFDATSGLWAPTGAPQATLSLLPGGGTLVGLTLSIPGANATWNKQAGDWNSTSNWVGGVPNGIDAVANFKSSITAARTVYADIATTAGTLNFDNANSYVISGAGTLSLQTSSGSAAVNVATGNHKINLPLTIVSNTNLNVSSGASLKISDPVTVNAGKSLASIGSGTVTYESTVTLQAGASLSLASSQHLAGLTIGSTATATVASGGGNNRVLIADSLSISGGKVDLKDNKMIFRGQGVGSWTGSIYTGATGLVQSGRNGGSWTGSGIVTSSASGNLTTLGVATAAQAKGIGALATTVWAGQTVSGADTLVMYTYGGDANLDGKINVDDYTRIDFNVPLGTSEWFNGDFNYDGKINVDDYTIIDFNVGIQGAPISSTVEAGGLTAVPEPASATLLVLGAATVLGRRRVRQSRLSAVQT
jgi:hypothetical protein